MLRAENINPSILSWARETAGLSLDEAAARLGLSDGKEVSAADKLQALENGEARPTRNQLLKIASTYRRPLTAFYMAKPPSKAVRGEDFRTTRLRVSSEDEALLDALLRDLRARQDMVKSIMEDDEDIAALPFVGSLSVGTAIVAAAETIRRSLDLGEVTGPWRFSGPEALFNDLRSRVEALGVFVLLIGNLGSHHSNISEDVFRGFAIADGIAPMIVINDQDAKAARSFTLIHELAHVFVGATGVSGAPILDATSGNARVERFCNDVASEFLLPKSLLSAPKAGSDIEAFVEAMASEWNVSEPMIAYRLHSAGMISGDLYDQLRGMYASRWRALRERTRESNRDVEGGPNYYTIRRHRLGAALLDLVNRNVRENSLTHTKAAKMLGVKPTSVEPLLAKPQPRRAVR